MKQKCTFEDSQQKFFLDGYKDLQNTGAKRFSLNLPDCSTVMESQNNNNLMDTNEISWLDKFAEDNEKICNSRILDETVNSHLKHQPPNNVMKFSFNMNYHNEDKKKDEGNHGHQQLWSFNPKSTDRENTSSLSRDYSTKKITSMNNTDNILSEIQDSQSTAKRQRKNTHAGSIKKNTKTKGSVQETSDYQREAIENLPYSKLEDMNDRLAKALSKDRSGNLQKIINKQNAKIFSEVSTANLFSVKPIKHTNRMENCLQEQKRNQYIPAPSFFEERPKIMEPRQLNKAKISTKYDYAPSLEILFNALDKSQTGKLSKLNCCTQKIPEDFKFIFGTIFTEIKFKQFVCNKKQFLHLCADIISQLDFSQVIDLLKKFQENNKKINVGGAALNEKTKSPFKSPVFQETTHLEQRKESKTKEISEPSKQANERKDFFADPLCKCGSKIQGETANILGQNSRNYRNFSQSTSKNSQNTKSIHKKQLIYDEKLAFYPKKSTYKDSHESSQSQFLQGTSRNKCSNISEETIQDHKKSLENLKRLNQRMQLCLSTNLLSQNSKSGLLQKDSLSFEELIKHV